MRKRLLKLLVLTGLAGLFIYTAFGNIRKTKPIKSGELETVVESTIQPQPQTKTLILKEIVENVLKDTDGAYGVTVKNLKTGESYFLNEHRTFEPGSLYKIWILATSFNQLENGKLKEDEVLSQDISMLNKKFNISSESAEMTEGQITLTVKDAIEQMITISHNYAALLLSERIKLSTVKAFLQERGLNESFLGEPPKTTAYDFVLFFEKLYKGELANKENTNKMLEILKRQTLNNKLPKYLPQKTIIAHKTGEIGNFSHDAGIVYAPNGNYIIVVLSESVSPVQTEERIANMSWAVYDYFAKERGN